MSLEYVNHWAILACVAAIAVYFIVRMYDLLLRQR